MIRSDFTVVIWGRGVYALPLGIDPFSLRWPANGCNVSIHSMAPRPLILRLLQALVRDGAVVAAGVDDSGELHLVNLRQGARDAA
jgi:hypothetical protein